MSALNAEKRLVLGNLLRRYRKKHGLSVRDVAQAVGIPFTNLAAMERGEKVKLKIRVLESLSSLYGIDKDVLCITAMRMPQDVFYKIVRNPHLLETIRNMEV